MALSEESKNRVSRKIREMHRSMLTGPRKISEKIYE